MDNRWVKYTVMIGTMSIILTATWFLANRGMAKYLPASDYVISEGLELCYVTVVDKHQQNITYKKFRYCQTHSNGTMVCNFLDYGYERIIWVNAKFICK